AFTAALICWKEPVDRRLQPSELFCHRWRSAVMAKTWSRPPPSVTAEAATIGPGPEPGGGAKPPLAPYCSSAPLVSTTSAGVAALTAWLSGALEPPRTLLVAAGVNVAVIECAMTLRPDTER